MYFSTEVGSPVSTFAFYSKPNQPERRDKRATILPPHWTIVKKFPGASRLYLSRLLEARNQLHGDEELRQRMEDRSDSPSKRRGTRCDARPETDAHRYASREREAVLYLERKGIRDIVDSLLGELLLRRPDDPYEHLTRLLDRRILTRDGLVDSPPPFSSR
ncbi:PREDICTED: uncharacterized protein LOC105570635 [Vollenhovia emeryi]|uniref:uncharacterized protein LOC105570635 n=1 Tax=Vollenhovia emeryi TaxID=411798 RepID=UPI0005F47662|nr:PREDICTED: uncharacterized protein LOC105570635 [Vollenhovia emeryi]